MANRVSVTNKKLQKELAEAKKNFEYFPDTWLGYEPLGRVLRWMNDPLARSYLEKAAIDYASYFTENQRSWDLIKAGNYYRLIKEQTTANTYFEDAYIAAEKEVGILNDSETVNYDNLQFFIQLCFLLGKYEEAIKYGRLFREDDPDPELLATLFAQLAEAKLTEDAVLAEDVIESIVNLIKSERAKIQSTGAVTLWDSYELALETLAEIEGDS